MKAEQPCSEMNHPSFLALDRAHLGAATHDVVAHLEQCGACREYLETLATTELAPSSALRQQALDRKKSPIPRSGWLAAAALAATFCGLILFIGPDQPPATRADEAYVGEKGFRSVWIYVRHGTETQLWDGKRPVAAGDRVRLKIDAGSYHRVEVYSLSDPQHPTRLYESALTPGQNLTLPDAWEIDDSPAPEQLFVVFSHVKVTPIWQKWRQGKVQPDIAVLPFVLPKASALSADAGPSNP